jgi:hypothetical protein
MVKVLENIAERFKYTGKIFHFPLPAGSSVVDDILHRKLKTTIRAYQEIINKDECRLHRILLPNAYKNYSCWTSEPPS